MQGGGWHGEGGVEGEAAGVLKGWRLGFAGDNNGVLGEGGRVQ